jgi:hypothetical protein
MRDLSTGDLVALLEDLIAAEAGEIAPFARYAEDPVGFATDVLGVYLYSVQREILSALVDHDSVVVVSAHGIGKTFIAATAVCWWIGCHGLRAGDAKVVTTAPTDRQVRALLWPEIRKLAARADLPGERLTTRWKIGLEDVAWGFAARAADETAWSGLHPPHLLMVIDEGGGVSRTIGDGTDDAMTTGHVRRLVIGNPPFDRVESWLKTIAEGPDSRYWHVIRVPVDRTPAYTGEVVPDDLVRSLDTRAWAERMIERLGDDDPYVLARVYAQFPDLVADSLIPAQWIEEAAGDDEAGWPTERVRLGVDIAAGGGDEMAVARYDVDGTVRIVSTARGPKIANAVDVAGMILDEIHAAEALGWERDRVRPEDRRVLVKVDAIGLGWGPVSTLQAWRSEGRHEADVVGVNVSMKPRPPEGPGDPGFYNQKAEMYWSFREAIAPGRGPARIRPVGLDDVEVAQLASARKERASSGAIRVESKEKIRARRGWSPDRAEAILLACYDPPAPDEAAGQEEIGVLA